MQDHDLAAEHDLAFHWFLYVIDADGQHQCRVTKTPIDMVFQWSPDGNRIVFQSSYEDRRNRGKDGTVSSAIYVMKADGTQERRLTPIDGDDSFPAWSPDGSRIAFCSNRHGNMDIFVMKADGSNTKRLTNEATDDTNSVWSPNGKQIAFTSSRKGIGSNVYVVNADGTGESSLAVSGFPMAWSPDGKQLLVASARQIGVVGADGQNKKQLTKTGDRPLDGVFSPDGKAVFYRSQLDGVWAIMLVGINDKAKRSVGDVGNVIGFSVSPHKRESSN